jgi:hypothetical protein
MMITPDVIKPKNTVPILALQVSVKYPGPRNYSVLTSEMEMPYNDLLQHTLLFATLGFLLCDLHDLPSVF